MSPEIQDQAATSKELCHDLECQLGSFGRPDALGRYEAAKVCRLLGLPGRCKALSKVRCNERVSASDIALLAFDSENVKVRRVVEAFCRRQVLSLLQPQQCQNIAEEKLEQVCQALLSIVNSVSPRLTKGDEYACFSL